MEESAVKPTVMAVDDSPEILMIMKSILENNYSLKLFGNSIEALDYALANPPDLILLDIMMPDMDGYQFCRLIKANPKLVDIPVIFITAKNEAEYVGYGFSVGASDYLQKPINAPLLISRVNTHLKLKLATEYIGNESARMQEGNNQTSPESLKMIEILRDNPFIKDN